MSAFTIEGQFGLGNKKPKSCIVTIYCACGNTFKTEMYDIEEHGFANAKCENCNRRYGARYVGWVIEQLKE